MKPFLITLCMFLVLPTSIVAQDTTATTKTGTIKVRKKPATDSAFDEERLTIVETMPEFPGGNKALQEFIRNNIRYPEEAIAKGAQGVVYVNFLIDTAGSVIQAKVLTRVDPLLEKEAIRVISSLPRFTPGMVRGLPANIWMTLPVRFELK